FQILRYTAMLVVITVLLAPAADLGLIYLGSVLALGGVFAWYAFRLWRHPERESPMTLYKYSLLYLALVFVAMGVDALVLG
ncbi:MAG: heme o synthase, partial [Tepidiformaceae bacterium]